MNDFPAMIASFGETLVMHLGRAELDALEVIGHEGSDTADVLVWLSDNSWDGQLRAMAAIEDVRMMFLGELFFEYRLLGEKEDAPDAYEAATAFSLSAA